ncbi:nuclear transport factor 2 family protein [Leisingera aquaemixtae]|uniref:nuclear transport factor 2 family protein n=1 Tax=Leisingera aquaemixtae TaxID=1396826 RepID=UPI001C95DE83|nr:nuclear transport factor 2 family protein [Leisingera aquaemixtae]MBY6065829.1 nuclear transport factor 2 family protein [Leisingera aquaemixtae]
MADETKSNAELLYEAWGKWNESKGSDPAMWRDYVNEDFKLFSLANGQHGVPFTAQCECYEDFERYLNGLLSTFEMLEWEVSETVSEGDTVVGLGRTRWKHRETKKEFDTPVAFVTRWADGRMYEYREFYDTAMVQGTTQAP